MADNTDKSQFGISALDGLPGDVDDERVIEMLRGAQRGPRDPDVSLSTLIANLRVADEKAILLALAGLVRDANSD